MSVHDPFFIKLSTADLARKRLQSLVNRIDVSFQVFQPSKHLPTLIALVWLVVLVHISDVPVKTAFYCECLATRRTSAVVHNCVDCAMVFQQV